MYEVTVVIPSYNHASYLDTAIQSVLGQTWHDLELIIVDDGSSDDSPKILQNIKNPRLKVLFQANRGASHAINRGLKEAQGKYLAILNSDDCYYPTRIEKLVGNLKENPDREMIGSYIQVIDEQNKPLGVKHGYLDLEPWPLEAAARSFRRSNNLKLALLTENYWATTSNFVFTRNLWDRVGEFVNLRYTHDWDFLLRASKTTDFALIPEPLLNYRVHSTNTIRENKAAMIFEICWILAAHLPKLMLTEWFGDRFASDRTEQLLSSIYTFGCDQVLNIMLLQNISENTQYAATLLEPANPARKILMSFIENKIAYHQHANQQNIPSEETELLRAYTAVQLLKILLRRTKNRFLH